MLPKAGYKVYSNIRGLQQVFGTWQNMLPRAGYTAYSNSRGL